jgi:V8-like Glu-specific endopeptidase
MKNSLFSFVLFIAASFGMASSSYAIVGGKLVASDDPIARSTVGILLQTAQGTAICTGSLISATQVLTAGHCAVGAQQIYIIFSTNIMQGAKDVGRVRQVVARRVSPDYIATALGVGDSSDHSDVAVLTFAGGVPAGYVTAKLMTRELAAVALRDEGRVTLAGYGATDYNATEGSGVLRKINTKIDKFYVSGKSVKVGTSDHGACHGDSGGPALVAYNGVNYVFAVTSRATATSGGSCTGRATYSLIY